MTYKGLVSRRCESGGSDAAPGWRGGPSGGCPWSWRPWGCFKHFYSRSAIAILKAVYPTLQRKSHLCIPFLGIAGASVPILTFMCCVCERFILYIPRIGPHISCSEIGRSIMGRYKSLTDTWMWKLGCGRAISFLGKFASIYRYWFFAV
jgi:hypothetical protein